VSEIFFQLSGSDWADCPLATIGALAPTLLHLHTIGSRLDLSIIYNLYLSNPPNPLPPVPVAMPTSTTLSPYRPEVAQLVREALPTTQDGGAGGLAVVACGPEGIVMEAKNAVAGRRVLQLVEQSLDVNVSI
jgi:ferric-chelate reductase